MMMSTRSPSRRTADTGFSGNLEFGPAGLLIQTQRKATAAPYALTRIIPDDPNYQKYIPINYRLNAKELIGEVAQDLSTRGKAAHVWVDLAHMGLAAAEIFAEGVPLVGGLAIAGPILGLVGVGLAMGAPYIEASEKVAANWSATGFSRGAVMGADKRRLRQLREYFGNDFFEQNHFFPRGRAIAIANYRMGLLVGFTNGLLLTENRRRIFWRDLGRRMGDQSYRGPKERWQQKDWRDWYVDVAAVFRRYHLS